MQYGIYNSFHETVLSIASPGSPHKLLNQTKSIRFRNTGCCVS